METTEKIEALRNLFKKRDDIQHDLKFAETLKEKPNQFRVCIYHNFLNSRYLDQWGLKELADVVCDAMVRKIEKRAAEIDALIDRIGVPEGGGR